MGNFFLLGALITLDTEYLSFLILALFLLLHSFFHTLYTVPLLSLSSLLLSLFSSIFPGKGCTTYFLLVFREEILVPNFCGFEPSCLYTSHTLHRSLLSPLWSIPSQVKAPPVEVYSLCHNIPMPFSMQNVLASFFAILFVVQPHILSAHFFSSIFLLLCLGIFICSAQLSNI